MIGQIAQAVGAPTPTVILDARDLPVEPQLLPDALTRVRRCLAAAGRADVLKFALVSPSPHPIFDLDYRFVQALPGGDDQFDFLGSCGHSILAAVLAAQENGWLPRLAPGDRVRVRVGVRDSGTTDSGGRPDGAVAVNVVCEVDEAHRRSGVFTAHFLPTTGIPLPDLLLTGRPVDPLLTDSGVHDASLVSMGNPYVFIDAAGLGLYSPEELFGAPPRAFDRMLAIRASAADLLGWPADSVFPKIAVVGGYRSGRLAVRAISVPGWHPSLALTGAICLAAAAAVPGTVPHRLARAVGATGETVSIDTPGGATAVTCAVSDHHLRWVSVGGKPAHLDTAVPITLHNDHVVRVEEEEQAWQPLTV